MSEWKNYGDVNPFEKGTFVRGCSEGFDIISINLDADTGRYALSAVTVIIDQWIDLNAVGSTENDANGDMRRLAVDVLEYYGPDEFSPITPDISNLSMLSKTEVIKICDSFDAGEFFSDELREEAKEEDNAACRMSLVNAEDWYMSAEWVYFENYVLDNFTLDSTSQRIIDSCIEYVKRRTNNGEYREAIEAVNDLYSLFGSDIGMNDDEIVDSLIVGAKLNKIEESKSERSNA